MKPASPAPPPRAGPRRLIWGLPVACLGTLLGGGLGGATTLGDAEEAARREHFEKRVRPVLIERCFSCHSAGAERLRGGLRVDSRAALLEGGDSGPALNLTTPDRSLLLRAIRYEDPDLQMPPKGRLPEAEVAALARWVQDGAVWPEDLMPAAATGPGEVFDLAERQRSHWAWQPIRPSAPPSAPGEDEPGHPVDRFIGARLAAEGLRPAPPARPDIRLRRLTFDLTGLPPAAAEVAAFEREPTMAAWERAVDALLASPRYGERWARHWLDLVRYAETLGHEFDYVIPNAWRYRDYVIRAFNADVPYRLLAQEHLAGDLLADPRRDPDDGANESVIGTAFYWLGQREHSPVDVRLHQAEVIDNQIDVLSKTFLGLTVACARCHDHKFDAISARDYYALYGILGSSRYAQASIEPPAGVAESVATLQRRRDELRSWLGPGFRCDPEAAANPSATVWADFGVQGYDGWFVEGEAFGREPARAGDLWIGEAPGPVGALTAGAAHSGALSRRLQGVLRSPTFTLERRYVHVLAAGRSGRLRLPVDNFTMIRDPIYGGLRRVLEHDDFRWITIDTAMWQGRRAYLEFADLRTPDLAADGPREGFAPDGWIAVRRVLFSDDAAPGAAEEALAGPSWSALPAEAWPAEETARARFEAAVAAYRQEEARWPDPRRVPASVEGTGLDERVFIRGQHRNLGEGVPRRFLEALGGNDRLIREGSGRLELAEQVTDPDNPFFARVMVNRVWLHLFGRGLVPTPDDFGVLGEPPSHPELLDWLAHWFRREGQWSTKRLIRLLVTSRTYQQASTPVDPVAAEKDPANRWWHRMPVRRLEGEAIRDALLALSGRLDLSPFGPPVPVHLTEFMDGRGRPSRSGPLDGDGRRSIYLEVRRNFLSPLMRTFDTPVPFTTIGRRTVSNVPAQALILMNDPLFQDEARRWARRLLAEPSLPPGTRIETAFRQAFSRPPSPQEISQALAFLETQTATYGNLGDELEVTVWADLCHVLLNTKEFLLLQ